MKELNRFVLWFSRTSWQSISIHLGCSWKTWLVVVCKAALSSQYRKLGLGWSIKNPVRNFNQVYSQQISHCSVFKLCRRTRYGRLFLSFLWDQGFPEKNKITGHWSSYIRICSLIGTRKPLRCNEDEEGKNKSWAGVNFVVTNNSMDNI